MTFAKYEESGAYHWRITYGGGLRRRSPRAHARYDLAVRLLAAGLELRGSRGVDLGCGDGVMPYKLWRRGARVTGVDGEADAIALGRRELERRGAREVELVVGSCYEVPLAAGSLDFVSAVEVIEHLDDVPRFCGEVSRLLRPGGLFVCTTPNRRPGQRPDEVRDPYHVREYTGAELADALAPHFAKVQVYGASPGWLDDRYADEDDRGLGARALRLGVKLTSVVWNPFCVTVTNPGEHWRQLAAAAHKHV